MQKLVLILAAVGVAAVPASAQTLMTPDLTATNRAISNQSSTAPVVQPKMVKKRVCQNVEVEQSTGSRLNSTSKICKIVEVPVPQNDGQPPATTGPNERH